MNRTFNLADLFEIVAGAVPERRAFECGDVHLTYRELDERTTRLGSALRQRGVLASEDAGADWELIERLWFGAAGMRIAGGTDEIVKNNVGERVLGLPPEPRADKNTPFSQLSR